MGLWEIFSHFLIFSFSHCPTFHFSPFPSPHKIRCRKNIVRHLIFINAVALRLLCGLEAFNLLKCAALYAGVNHAVKTFDD